jgi:hypothetical protein
MPSNDGIKEKKKRKKKERKKHADKFFLAASASISKKKLQCCAGRVKTSEAERKQCTRDKIGGKINFHQLKETKSNVINDRTKKVVKPPKCRWTE